MFSLNGAITYKYLPRYQDMRGGYDKLCGVIRSLGYDPTDGSAYVFTSKDQKLVKIIHYENGQCQLYYQRFDKGQNFIKLTFRDSTPVYTLEWRYLVLLLECPTVRQVSVEDPTSLDLLETA